MKQEWYDHLIDKWVVQTTHTDKATKLSRNSKAWLDAHGFLKLDQMLTLERLRASDKLDQKRYWDKAGEERLSHDLHLW
jgi:hypothetical protein